MQLSAKDAYAKMQSTMMLVAFFVIGLLSITVMIFEATKLDAAEPIISQVVSIFSVVLALMFLSVTMMIVEIIYQEEIKQFPFIGILYRLTPDLLIEQRIAFLSTVSKRQILVTAIVAFIWIIVGDTPRAESLVYAITLVSAFTKYGLEHVKKLPSSSTEVNEHDTTSPTETSEH